MQRALKIVDDREPVRSSQESPLRTVCHTLPTPLAERLRLFAFEQRLSESAILEFAFTTLLQRDSESKIAAHMRAAGYGLRRKSTATT
ncbi:MAG: hypothetical protein NVS2B3_15920 [Vulcanimicrobiaceae bacterium]